MFIKLVLISLVKCRNFCTDVIVMLLLVVEDYIHGVISCLE